MILNIFRWTGEKALVNGLPSVAMKAKSNFWLGKMMEFKSENPEVKPDYILSELSWRPIYEYMARTDLKDID